jgi:hypothetical protein
LHFHLFFFSSAPLVVVVVVRWVIINIKNDGEWDDLIECVIHDDDASSRDFRIKKSQPRVNAAITATMWGKASKGRKKMGVPTERTRGEPFRPSHLIFLWFYVLICLTLGGCMTHLYIHRATFVYMRSFPLTCVHQGINRAGAEENKVTPNPDKVMYLFIYWSFRLNFHQ